MAGRKPKPTALKKLEGNPGKRKLNTKEPMPGKGMPDCPKWLLPEAKMEWERLCVKLSEMGVLTEIDMAAFAAYCQSYARWKEAQEHIDSEGSIFETDKGYQQQTPWVGIANTNQKLMMQAASEFGLTPSARSRIMAASGVGKDEEDEMEALLGGEACSSLGLSLKTLSHLFRYGGIDSALEQFRQAIGQLETDLEMANNRLENAKNYYHIFDMLRQGITSEIINVPTTYYYPRPQDSPFFAEMNPALYGAVRMVFRIKHTDVYAEDYPPGQGFLSPQLIPSCTIPSIEIPAHRGWFTVMEEEPDGFVNREKIAAVLDQMKAEGCRLHGDILLTQILNASDRTAKKLICIECDAGPL